MQAWAYVNVPAPITTQNVYWLFGTAKRTGRIYFSFNPKLAQSEYETVVDRDFLRDILPCYSPRVRLSYGFLKF